MCLPNSEGETICNQDIESQISDLVFEFPTPHNFGGIFEWAPAFDGFNGTYLPAPWHFMKDWLLHRRLVGICVHNRIIKRVVLGRISCGFRFHLPPSSQRLRVLIIVAVIAWGGGPSVVARCILTGCSYNFRTIIGGTETTLYDQKDMRYHPFTVTDCVNVGNLGLNPMKDNNWSASWTSL